MDASYTNVILGMFIYLDCGGISLKREIQTFPSSATTIYPFRWRHSVASQMIKSLQHVCVCIRVSSWIGMTKTLRRPDARTTWTGSSQCGGVAVLLQPPPGCSNLLIWSIRFNPAPLWRKLILAACFCISFFQSPPKAHSPKTRVGMGMDCDIECSASWLSLAFHLNSLL